MNWKHYLPWWPFLVFFIAANLISGGYGIWVFSQLARDGQSVQGRIGSAQWKSGRGRNLHCQVIWRMNDRDYTGTFMLPESLGKQYADADNHLLQDRLTLRSVRSNPEMARLDVMPVSLFGSIMACFFSLGLIYLLWHLIHYGHWDGQFHWSRGVGG